MSAESDRLSAQIAELEKRKATIGNDAIVDGEAVNQINAAIAALQSALDALHQEEA